MNLILTELYVSVSDQAELIEKGFLEEIHQSWVLKEEKTTISRGLGRYQLA